MITTTTTTTTRKRTMFLAIGDPFPSAAIIIPRTMFMLLAAGNTV